MVLAVMTEPQFQRLMKEIGRADALADPRFADWPTRIQNNKALHDIIEAELDEADVGQPGPSASPRPTCRPAACSAFPRP